MMYLEGTVFAHVWKTEPAENGKYIDLRITTSKRDEDGHYENSSWFPRCIGTAVQSLKNVKCGDRIIIKKVIIENPRIKQEDGTYKSYFRFLIIDAEIANSEGDSQHSTAAQPRPENENKVKQAPAEDEVDIPCPW